jgi:hypothetical protein
MEAVKSLLTLRGLDSCQQKLLQLPAIASTIFKINSRPDHAVTGDLQNLAL